MALSRLGSTAPFTPPAKLKEGLARTQASCSVFWPPAFSPSFLLPIPFYYPPSPLLGLTHTYTGVSYRIFHEVLTSSTFLLFLSSYFFCTPLSSVSLCLIYILHRSFRLRHPSSSDF